jgi:hypothetical protein
MKKLIAVLTSILSLVAFNLNSQVQNVVVSPTNVCTPVSGNATITVQYTVNGLGTVAGCYSLALMPNTTLVPTYLVGGGASNVTITPGVNTGTILGVVSSSMASAANIKLNFYTSCSTYNSTYSSGNYSINIIAPPTTTVTSTPSNTICAGNSVTLSASGANNYTWMPSTFSNTVSVSPSVNTNYTVSVSNSICPAVVVNSTVSVIVYSVPNISANNGSICLGQTYNIPLSGASSYSLNNVSISSPYSVAPTSNTSYTIKGSSAQGCVSSNTIISVVVNSNPTVSVNSGSICVGNQFVIVPTATSATSFSYSGGSATVSPFSTTNYVVTAYNLSGCTATAVSSVVVHSLPVVSVNSGSICAGNQFVIIPSGASNYTVQGGSYTVSPVTNSTYSVVGTSSVGCLSNPVVSSVVVNSLPTISVNSGSICSGQNFILIASGASSYVVSGGSMVVSPLNTTNYTVSGISSFGCQSSNTVVATVSVNALPIITVNSGTICSGKVFTIIPAGAVSYTVQGGSYTVNPSSNATYTVVGTNSMGCISAFSATSSIFVNSLPVINISSSSSTLCEGNTATLTASGANSFTWNGNNNGSQFIINPNVTTTYTVTGVNNNGCENTVNFTQTVVVCTSVYENALNISNRMYPVPANQDLTIEINGVTHDVSVSITIYSIEGKVLLTRIQDLYNSTAKIDLSNFQNGVYMVEVKSESFKFSKNIIVAK